MCNCNYCIVIVARVKRSRQVNWTTSCRSHDIDFLRYFNYMYISQFGVWQLSARTPLVRRLFRCINYLFVPRELAVADDWTPGVRATRRYRMQFIGSNDQNTAPWWPFSEHIGFAFFVTFSFSLLHVLRCTLNWLTANFERKHVFCIVSSRSVSLCCK